MDLAFGSGLPRRGPEHEPPSGAAPVARPVRLLTISLHHGVFIRSRSMRGVAEEAPGAYKDVSEVVDAADRAGLARTVARLEPVICIKG